MPTITDLARLADLLASTSDPDDHAAISAEAQRHADLLHRAQMAGVL